MILFKGRLLDTELRSWFLRCVVTMVQGHSGPNFALPEISALQYWLTFAWFVLDTDLGLMSEHEPTFPSVRNHFVAQQPTAMI